MRLLFVSDLHSSLAVWAEALKQSIYHKVDLLVLGGDHTGKFLVPIIISDRGWKASFNDQTFFLKNEAELHKFQEKISKVGVYSKIMSKQEVKRMQSNPSYFDNIFSEEIGNHFEKAINIIFRDNIPQSLNILVSPGNDDPFYIDNILQRFKKDNFHPGINNVLNILGYTFVNFEYTPPTPWDTPRELSEQQILENIKKLLQPYNSEKLIFNFHCPPHKTLIDRAPKLDSELKPIIKSGQLVYDYIGSKSIRKLIEKYQPICSLHGHCHESPGKVSIGKTICYNPGSEYDQGIFRGYLIEIDGYSIIDSWSIIN